MKKGDLVKLSIRGTVSLCMGGYKNPDMYGTGVFLGWACHDMYGSQTIAKIYWLGGYGLTETHKDYFQKILDKSLEQDTLPI